MKSNKSNLDLIKKDLTAHKVSVLLPGKRKKRELYLIIMNAKIDVSVDLLETYGDSAFDFSEKLKSVLGDTNVRQVENGVFVDDNLTPVFSFNRLFADFNRETGEIVYKKPIDIFADLVKEKKPFPSGPVRPPQPSFPDMVLRYSLPEREELK